MTCDGSISVLTCAGGESHSITALGCCDSTVETLTPYTVQPTPFFVLDTNAIGSVRYNPVISEPPPGGSQSFTEIVVPEDEPVVSRYDVLGEPPFTSDGFVDTKPARPGEIEIAPPSGGTTGSTGSRYHWYVIVDS